MRKRWFILLALTLSSCYHVNNLKDYDLTQKKALFEYSVVNGKGTTVINAPAIQAKEEHKSENKDEHKDEHKDNKSNDSKQEQTSKDERQKKEQAETATNLAIYKEATATRLDEKLNYAAGKVNFSDILGEATKNIMLKYLQFKPSDGMTEDYKFIVNTNLMEYSIIASSDKSTLHLTLMVQIIDRNTANIVWQERKIAESILKFSSAGDLAKSLGSAKVGSAVQLVELSMLREEDIEASLISAAKSAVNSITETLLQDIRESHEN